MVKQWKIQVERDRNPNKSYNESEYRLKYKAFTMKRTIQKIWHQARLNVIPMNHFLYNIKFSATFKCKFDNQPETNEHFLIESKGYEKIETRNQQKIERLPLKLAKRKLIGKEETIEDSKQIIHEIVQNIVEKAIETAHNRSKETDKKLNKLLSGKPNRKRKYEISIKIL